MNIKNITEFNFLLSVLIVGISSVVFLIAGIHIGLYNELAYDDFSRSVDTGLSYWKGVLDWYYYHNGRYTNALIADSHLLYQSKVYRILHITSVGAWILALFYFVRAYFSLVKLTPGLMITTVVASALFLASTANSPNISEWWFWYASSSVYMIGGAMLLFGLGLFIKACKTNRIDYWFWSGMVLFFSAGNHEVIVMISGAVIGTVFLVLAFTKRRYLPLIPLVFILVGMAMILHSPGTSSRLNSVSGNDLNTQLVEQ